MEMSAFTIIISSLPMEDRKRLKTYKNTINKTAGKKLDGEYKVNKKVQTEEK
jgi:hypothetical protein